VLDEEAVARIAAQVVNGAWTARGKKLREEITADFNKGLEGITKQLADMNAGNGEGKGRKGRTEGGDELDPKMKGLERQLAEQKAEHDRLMSELAAEKQQRKDGALRQTLAEELAKSGITDPTRQRIATAHLLSQGLVVHGEDGSPLYAESADSHLDLATGIKAWSKSEEAKIFLPPTGARGSGDRPVQGGPKSQANGSEPTATDLGLALVREFGGIPVG
jgi:hypothetical protein